jgi:hypothetical protein
MVFGGAAAEGAADGRLAWAVAAGSAGLGIGAGGFGAPVMRPGAGADWCMGFWHASVAPGADSSAGGAMGGVGGGAFDPPQR